MAHSGAGWNVFQPPRVDDRARIASPAAGTIRTAISSSRRYRTISGGRAAPAGTHATAGWETPGSDQDDRRAGPTIDDDVGHEKELMAHHSADSDLAVAMAAAR